MTTTLTVENLATEQAIKFIGDQEDCRLVAYLDQARIWTIGYGMTRYPNGRKVQQGDTLPSKAEAMRLFKETVQIECDQILRIPTWNLMNPSQKTAVTSFAYNLGEYFYGAYGFESITRLLKAPNTWSNQQEVHRVFGLYNKAGGAVSNGLIKRRSEEAQLFLTPAEGVAPKRPIELRIRATRDTWLKKSWMKQADELDNTMKAFCPMGKEYTITDITNEASDGNNIKQAGYTFSRIKWGGGDWYLWNDHWAFPDVGDPDIYQDAIEGYSNRVKDAVQRQFARLNAYTNQYNIDREVLYFRQRDNPKQPHASCNSSANCMYGDFIAKAVGKPGTDDDAAYVNLVYSQEFYKPILGGVHKNPSIFHGVQTQALFRYFGIYTKWMTDGDVEFVQALLEAGLPVTFNILHRGSINAPDGGHIVCGVKYDRKRRVYIVHDPYGTLASNYTNTNGKYSEITERDFNARWERDYRILADAPRRS